jgi:alkylation response protein AidB-like acyl-CoA dehydrogenase
MVVFAIALKEEPGMPYIAQSRDAKFNLFEWLDIDKILKSPLFSDFGKEDFEMIVDEALKVARGTVAATNEEGDRVGAKFADGKVTVPDSFKSAFEEVSGAGYIGSTASPEHSGMGLPEIVGTAVNEFIIGANTSLSLALLLTRGTAHLVETFGTDELKKIICEKMYTGTWAGTMCLTEPQAGSDLGDIQTKAIKQPDGSYHLQGQKIFITWGEHDITGNIIHAVLARTPEAPVGSKGLSLFIVPKMRINPDGSTGEFNNVVCAGIEHKMGIHGSPTCTLLFGEKGPSVGWILGKERMGLPYMFQMMNAARYEVGLQGLAIASAAYETALSYTKERKQGRPYNQKDPHYPQVPIVEHPETRRTLAVQKSLLEAMRAIQFYTAWCLDMAAISEGEEKNYYQGFVELFTPICKAWCTDRGFEITSHALQCYGGYGFTKEMPAEQYMRDARIAPIYEGTNAIQALDLVGRKFKLQSGEPVRKLLAMAKAKAVELENDPLFSRAAKNLMEAVDLANSVCEKMMAANKDVLFISMNAVPVLDLLGETLGGYFLLSQAEVARKKLEEIAASSAKERKELLSENENARFYHNKIQSALFFGARILPFVKARVAGTDQETSAMDFVF